MEQRGFVSRSWLASLLGAAALIATQASPAGAAVTIGQTFIPDQDFGGSGTFIQTSSPDGSYAVPSDGVITSWSFQAAAGPTPPIKLKMFRFVSGTDYTTVGESQVVTPTAGILNTFPTRIPVKGGDVPAHFYSDTSVAFRNVPGYDAVFNSGAPGDPSLDAPPGTTLTYEFDAGDQLDLSAVLEPDADRDGFGDESQDKCIGTPGTANGCPSTVKIDSVKQKGSKKVKVTATVPGAGTLDIGSPSDPALASKAAKAKSLKRVTTTLTATTKQKLKLTLKLTKSAIARLEDADKLKLKVKAVYTPIGGPAGSQTRKTKLKG
jgi:hypothetical protein